MAQVPVTFVEYTGNGVQTQFTVPFEFISRDYVFVTVGGATTPFTWINDALVEVTPAPSMGTEVRIYRSTAAVDIFHAFDLGVPFLPRYVDENNTQLLHATQEAVNDTAGTAADALAAAEAALALVEDATFDSAAVLRNDLADTIDPAKGDVLLGVKRVSPGAVARTQHDHNADTPSIRDYGARSILEAGFGSFDSSAAIQACATANIAVYIPEGVYLCSGITLRAGQRVYGPGELRSLGTGNVLTIPLGAPDVHIYDITLRGVKLSNEANRAETGIVCNDSGFLIDGCTITEFGNAGIVLGTQGPSFANQSQISNCSIHRNSLGINTQSFEYCRIDSNRITDNGWTADHTAASVGIPVAAGIFGNLANCPVTNNQVVDNVFGIYLNAGAAAPNPDHSIIAHNVINHNGAAGLVLVELKNYELVIGNTIISNVNVVPGVVYPPTGTTVDMALVDAHGLVFTGNTVGTGSDTFLPIYGHGRCRYTNNVFAYGPPTELRAPAVGTPLRDLWGCTVNQDNIWRDNWFFNFTRPVLFAGTIRTIIRDNLESGVLVDGTKSVPTFGTGWVSSGYDTIKYWREDRVLHIAGSVQKNVGAAAIAFTLPVGFRPAVTSLRPCIVSDAGAPGVAVLYSNGDVILATVADNAIASLDVTILL